MEFELKISGAASPETLASLLTVLKGSVAFGNAATPAPAETEKKGRGKAAKTETATQAAAAPVTDATSNAELDALMGGNDEDEGADLAGLIGGDAPAAAPVPTIPELTTAVQAKVKGKDGKATIQKLIAQHGGKTLSDMPEANRAAFLADVNKL